MRTLASTSLVLLVTAGMTGVPQVSHADSVAVPSDVGKRYDAEWKTRPALDPDYEVVQLTTSKALDNKMYLGADPYVPSLNSVVFMSDRGKDRADHENLFLMSLDNGKFVQLTDSDVIDGAHANVSPKTEEVVFREQQTFKRVSLHEPYKETKIRTFDDKYDPKGIPSLTSDGKAFAMSLYDEDEDRSTLVVVVDVKSGDVETVKKIDGVVDHVLINPRYGDTLLYHIFDENEIGIVDIESGKKKVLTDSGDHGVHPFWGGYGIDAAYNEKEHDPRQIVTYDIRKERYLRYDIPVQGNHFDWNPIQTVFQSDGAKSDPYIYYYKIDPDDHTVDPRKMCKHNSSSEEEVVHPHASFINNHDLLFNSDADDSGDVYLLRRK